MAKQFLHDEAMQIAGDLYGTLLKRGADRDGCEHVVHCLVNGTKSIQQIVLEFICSDEFIDRFATGMSSASTAIFLTKLLVGRTLEADYDVQVARRQLIRLGLRRYAEQIAMSPEYMQKVGANSVPRFG